MYQYYETKKITLVGPISSDNLKVFGSLTYYMLMPFAALGQFEPISPVYGTVFWGVLTAFIMMFLVKKLNPSLVPYAAALGILWYPLLQTSRWAWNPNLMPFWVGLGLWLFLTETILSYFFAGLSLGLAFHNHYIAIIGTGFFVATASILFILKRKVKEAVALFAGYVIAFLPFVLFDLRHPPGLFFTKYLIHGNVQDYQPHTVNSLISNIGTNIELFFFYLTQDTVLAILLAFLFIGLLMYDFNRNKKALLYFFPVFFQVIGASFIETPAERYILPALFFVLIWIVFPRKNYGAVVSRFIMIILVVGALFSIYPQLHYSEIKPDLTTVSKVDHIIANTVKKNNLKDVNIAAVQSPDIDPTGAKYRDMMTIFGVSLRASTEYDATQNLFVISTAPQNSLRKGKDYALAIFRSAKLIKTFPIENGPWKVYWFKR
jgi:4-amino-4-deoxy-L-arabinose transferase-like glycosyltransferase